MRKISQLFLASLFLLSVNPSMPQAHAETTTQVISKGSASLPVVVGIKGLPAVSNPFDESLAKIFVKITRPDDSTISATAYWYQEYKIQNINNHARTVLGNDYTSCENEYIKGSKKIFDSRIEARKG